MPVTVSVKGADGHQAAVHSPSYSPTPASLLTLTHSHSLTLTLTPVREEATGEAGARAARLYAYMAAAGRLSQVSRDEVVEMMASGEELPGMCVCVGRRGRCRSGVFLFSTGEHGSGWLVLKRLGNVCVRGFHTPGAAHAAIMSAMPGPSCLRQVSEASAVPPTFMCQPSDPMLFALPSHHPSLVGLRGFGTCVGGGRGAASHAGRADGGCGGG